MLTQSQRTLMRFIAAQCAVNLTMNQDGVTFYWSKRSLHFTCDEVATLGRKGEIFKAVKAEFGACHEEH